MTGSYRRTTIARVVPEIALIIALVTAGFIVASAKADAVANWSSAALPTTPVAGDNITISGVSCSDPTDCVAVGDYSASAATPFVEVLTSAGWNPSVLPLPAGDASALLSAVSCSDATDCVAVGQQTATGSTAGNLPFSEIYTSTGWAPGPQFPAPSSGNPIGQITLRGISCTAVASCVAVGDAATSSSVREGIAYTLSGSVWSPPATGLDDHGYTSSAVTLGGVSCTSTTACTAVGSEEYSNPQLQGSSTELLVETLSGGTWTLTDNTNPTSLSNAALSAVSCTPTLCEAVGSFTGSDGTQALVESGSGSTWNAVIDLEPVNVGAVGSVLTGVSCFTATQCTAVGSYTTTSQELTLGATLTGTTWTSVTGMDPVGETTTGFTGISCVPSSLDCEAVGDGTNTTGLNQPFASQYVAFPAASLSVATPASAVAGAPVTVTVTALDASGAVATGYTGTVQLSSSDPSATLPASAMLVNGVGQFNLTLRTTGSQTITATGTMPGITGMSAPITVGPAATRFGFVNTPAAAASGSPVTLSLSAYAGNGAVADTYPGTVQFTSSDPAAVLPPDSSLAGGSGSFSVTFNTPGVQTITATDTLSGVTGTSGAIAVSGAPSGLTAVGSTGQISLTWLAPPGSGSVTGYEIFRATSSGGEASGALATATSTSYVDTSAQAGVVYYYEVKAVTAAGTSLSSNEASAVEPTSPAGGVRFTGTPDGQGYWLVSRTGVVTPFGDATGYGSLSGAPLNQPIVSMAATPDGHGYWLVAADGGIFSFGDARFYGSLGSLKLNQPIVGMASSVDGKGYVLVASDGGIFAFGDARFYGSLGSLKLNQPIVALSPTPDHGGYWLVASDGGVFAFGDARFLGSLGSSRLAQPIVGMASAPDGSGYWMVAADGGIFSFGTAKYLGSLGGTSIFWPIVGMSAEPNGAGYSIVNAIGVSSHFGS
jgi:hypothetical protein